MNVYFLVEGKTERKIYHGWLSIIVPDLIEVKLYNGVIRNNYYIFDGGGLPSYYKQIKPSISKINKIGKYDYFVICVDAENATIEQRTSKINKIISDSEQLNEKTKLIIIVQNRCIETWLLGNRNVYTTEPKNNPIFIQYSQHYNVDQDDPELMETPDTFKGSVADFHERYLRAMIHERRNKEDSRFHEEKYLNGLKDRIIDTPTHIKTFKNFINFCEEIKSEISQAN